MASVTLQDSEELFVSPGEPRAFGFPVPQGVRGFPLFSQAFPSKPRGGKQSLWTVSHGIETGGTTGGEFPGHRFIGHWVTVQVADPQIMTPFTITTMVITP